MPSQVAQRVTTSREGAGGRSLLVITWICTCWLMSIGCSASVNKSPRIPLSGGRTVSDPVMTLRAGDGERTLSLHYRSVVLVRECETVQQEVREIWTTFLRDEATRRKAEVALITPEDMKLESIGYMFRRQPDGTWRESGFSSCSKSGAEPTHDNSNGAHRWGSRGSLTMAVSRPSCSSSTSNRSTC
jgi:hypothetical protein